MKAEATWKQIHAFRGDDDYDDETAEDQGNLPGGGDPD